MKHTGTKIGAALGFIVFLAFGLLPSFYFGSYGSLLILSKLAGHSVEPTTFVRMFVVVGVLLGATCTAFASIVIGSVFGTSLSFLVSLFDVKVTEKTQSETA